MHSGDGHRSQLGNVYFPFQVSLISVYPRIFWDLKEHPVPPLPQAGTPSIRKISQGVVESKEKKEEKNSTEKTKWLNISNFQIKCFCWRKWVEDWETKKLQSLAK